MDPLAASYKDFRSVSCCCRSCPEATKAPVEGEEHPLDIDVDVEFRPVFDVVSVEEVMIVIEIIEIGEPVFATERQIFGDPILGATTEGEAIGIEVITIVEVAAVAVFAPETPVTVKIRP